MDGLHAVSPAEVVPKNVLEPVPVPLHVMAGDHAQEQRGKRKRATSRRALVRNKTYSVVSSNGCAVLGPFLLSIRRFSLSSHHSLRTCELSSVSSRLTHAR